MNEEGDRHEKILTPVAWWLGRSVSVWLAYFSSLQVDTSITTGGRRTLKVPKPESSRMKRRHFLDTVVAVA